MKTNVSQLIYAEIKQSLADAGRLYPEKERQFVERYLGTKRKFLNVKSFRR